MWAVRTFGWTILAMGIVVLVAIPFLVMSGRGDEAMEAIVVGLVSVFAGFLIVRFITKPDQ